MICREVRESGGGTFDGGSWGVMEVVNDCEHEAVGSDSPMIVALPLIQRCYHPRSGIGLSARGDGVGEEDCRCRIQR